MLADTPSEKAARQAAMVAPAERRERSTIASLQGKPISRIACGLTLPSLTAEIHSAVCASASSSSPARGATSITTAGSCSSRRSRSMA